MEQYFEKYRNNALTYAILFILMLPLSIFLLTREGWFTGNDFIFTYFFFLSSLIVVLWSAISNYLKFKNKIVIWENLEGFLEVNEQNIFTYLGSNPIPSAGLEYFEHDLLLENQGVEIKIKGVSPFYSKRIIDGAEKSPNKLFKMWFRYGPKKGENYDSELIIEPA